MWMWYSCGQGLFYLLIVCVVCLVMFVWSDTADGVKSAEMPVELRSVLLWPLGVASSKSNL